mmetsp:Transcript_62151/g.173637  ORF Transcript_62151/g.173637 Transcript_62151/m.173637 type:complete len:305 (+) Transcript_62151:272-1186(+)
MPSSTATWLTWPPRSSGHKSDKDTGTPVTSVSGGNCGRPTTAGGRRTPVVSLSHLWAAARKGGASHNCGTMASSPNVHIGRTLRRSSSANLMNPWCCEMRQMWRPGVAKTLSCAPPGKMATLLPSRSTLRMKGLVHSKAPNLRNASKNPGKTPQAPDATAARRRMCGNQRWCSPGPASAGSGSSAPEAVTPWQPPPAHVSPLRMAPTGSKPCGCMPITYCSWPCNRVRSCGLNCRHSSDKTIREPWKTCAVIHCQICAFVATSDQPRSSRVEPASLSGPRAAQTRNGACSNATRSSKQMRHEPK